MTEHHLSTPSFQTVVLVFPLAKTPQPICVLTTQVNMTLQLLMMPDTGADTVIGPQYLQNLVAYSLPY